MACWGGAAAVEDGLVWAGGACAGAEGREGARMPVERAPPDCRRGILKVCCFFARTVTAGLRFCSVVTREGFRIRGFAGLRMGWKIVGG